MSEDRNDRSDRDEQGVDGSGASPGNGAPAAAPATPEERLAAMTAERDDMKDRMLRIAAEFENWKKRSRKEQTDAVAQARESVLKDVLEIADNLERAMGAQAQVGGKGGAGAGAVDGAAVVKGVNLVLRLFQQKLERYEVRPFETTGQPFDPRLAEAIATKPAPEGVAEDTVLDEAHKAYTIGDEVLRPAQVVVAKNA